MRRGLLAVLLLVVLLTVPGSLAWGSSSKPLRPLSTVDRVYADGSRWAVLASTDQRTLEIADGAGSALHGQSVDLTGPCQSSRGGAPTAVGSGFVAIRCNPEYTRTPSGPTYLVYELQTGVSIPLGYDALPGSSDGPGEIVGVGSQWLDVSTPDHFSSTPSRSLVNWRDGRLLAQDARREQVIDLDSPTGSSPLCAGIRRASGYQRVSASGSSFFAYRGRTALSVRSTGKTAQLVLQRCGGKTKVLPDSRGATMPALGDSTVSWAVGDTVLTQSLTSERTTRWRMPSGLNVVSRTGTAGRFVFVSGFRSDPKNSWNYIAGSLAARL